jgi:hypothetical protein
MMELNLEIHTLAMQMRKNEKQRWKRRSKCAHITAHNTATRHLIYGCLALKMWARPTCLFNFLNTCLDRSYLSVLQFFTSRFSNKHLEVEISLKTLLLDQRL